MAKGSRFLPRQRRIAGQATGSVVCNINLPALDEKFDRRFGFAYRDGIHARKLTRVRRFVREKLPQTETASEGATVVIVASVRKANGALAWTELSKWQSGESLAAFLDAADEAWLCLPKEEGWNTTEAVEIKPPTSPVKRRRRDRAV
jgi:hypothetical protein